MIFQKKGFNKPAFYAFLLIQYPQVYLEQCKYKMKKRELKSFIDYEIDISSEDYDRDLDN